MDAEYIKQLEKQNAQLLERCAYLEKIDDIIKFVKATGASAPRHVPPETLYDLKNMFSVDMESHLLEISIDVFLESLGSTYKEFRKSIESRYPNVKWSWKIK